MKAMIHGRSFETRNHLPAAAPRAAIQAALREAAIREEVIPAEVIPAEVIRGPATRAEAVAEGPPRADNKTPARTSKTTKKCSR